MIIVSQNATNYDIELPEKCVYRINLAWCNSLNELESILEKHQKHNIFLDLPISRIKPPNNKYSLEEIIPLMKKYNNVKFFAVSNVESSDDLKSFIELIPKETTIIPKIESPDAVDNIKSITDSLPNSKRIVMLDHDDLFSSLIRKNENKDQFKKYIEKLVKFCEENEIGLLRTVGVIFSDDEKRISQYVK
jgi:hypothetical protein